MPLNPSSHVPLTNTVPSVAAMKELRVEHLHQVRTLQQQLQQCANSNNSSSEGGEDARSTSTGSAQGDDADQSVLGRAGQHHLNMSVLEAPHQGAASSSSGGSHAACPASCASAVALRNSEKLNLRLKEMFKERISSFREGVYLLTGFKVSQSYCVVVYFPQAILFLFTVILDFTSPNSNSDVYFLTNCCTGGAHRS